MKTKKINKSTEEYEIKFWKDWLESDTLKRLDIVKKLPLLDMCLKMKNEKIWRESFSSLVNGYFEDLESAVYLKIHCSINNESWIPSSLQKSRLYTKKM
ncbi:MAG TPA: hypothetical protein VJB05_00160 [archaeon]|nr:hypothetical protein [archaeon]